MTGALIDQFLEAVPLSPAIRSVAARRLRLHVRRAERAQALWRGLLTEDGFPVEFRDSTARGGFRYTLEPVLRPATSEQMGSLEKFLSPAGPAAFEHFARWAHDVRDGELRWGCWLGCRHDDERTTFKLYLEYPPTDMPVTPPGPQAELRLRLVGIDLDSGLKEYYYRLERLSWERLGGLLDASGLIAERSVLFETLSELLGCRPEGEMPGTGYGVSWAADGEGRPPRFSLFAPARRFFGPDRQLGEAVPGYCQSRGLSMNLLDAALRVWKGAMVWGFAAWTPEGEGVNLDIGFAPSSAWKPDRGDH